MNILNLDLKSAIYYAIEAYVHIWGEENRDIIAKKINNSIIIPYCNPDDLLEYTNYLKDCKCRQLSIKYVKELGIETDINNYSKSFSIELEAKICKLIGFSIEYAFRNPCTNQINEEVYNKYYQEYIEFKNTLKEYYKYINSALKRKKEIEANRLDSIFYEIEQSLPIAVKEKLKDKSLEEKEKVLFGKLSEPFLIEYFSDGNIKKLFKEKNIMILANQLIYFRNLGIKIDYNLDMKNLNLEKYYKIINSEEIKKYILPNDLILIISSYRNKQYKEYIKEYIEYRQDYFKYKDQMKNYDTNIIHNIILSKITGVTNEKNLINNEYTPILMYNACNWNGNMARIFLHEVGHILDFNSEVTGFDTSIDKIRIGKRKYETFNEIIVDIYAERAFNYLKENNIYLFEPCEITQLENPNDNTSLEMKNLIMPLVEKYNSYIIKARISGKPKILINKIGKENYEDLVNLVNELANNRSRFVPINIKKIDKKKVEIYSNIEAKRYLK